MKMIEEDDLHSLSEGTEEGQISIADLPQNVDLVDLIEQPAWKSILVELVRTERMDPWSIDIAGLAEKYLKKINALTGTDLRIPANAILASAILLKFKSNVLRISEIEDEDDFLAQKKAMTPEERAEFEALIPDLKTIRKIKEGIFHSSFFRPTEVINITTRFHLFNSPIVILISFSTPKGFQ